MIDRFLHSIAVIYPCFLQMKKLYTILMKISNTKHPIQCEMAISIVAERTKIGRQNFLIL